MMQCVSWAEANSVKTLNTRSIHLRGKILKSAREALKKKKPAKRFFTSDFAALHHYTVHCGLC